MSTSQSKFAAIALYLFWCRARREILNTTEGGGKFSCWNVSPSVFVCFAARPTSVCCEAHVCLFVLTVRSMCVCCSCPHFVVLAHSFVF
jgi:hypothetical protein